MRQTVPPLLLATALTLGLFAMAWISVAAGLNRFAMLLLAGTVSWSPLWLIATTVAAALTIALTYIRRGKSERGLPRR